MSDGKWIHVYPDELERICFALRQRGDQSLARRLAFRWDKSAVRRLDLGPRELDDVHRCRECNEPFQWGMATGWTCPNGHPWFI